MPATEPYAPPTAAEIRRLARRMGALGDGKSLGLVIAAHLTCISVEASSESTREYVLQQLRVTLAYIEAGGARVGSDGAGQVRH